MAKVSNETRETCRIITTEFRVSYPHLFKPNAVKQGDKPKYSITMLFQKKADLSSLKLAMKHAKIAEFGPNRADWPKDLMSPVTDGDDPKHAEKEGYAGHWVIKATSNEENKPGLVDANAEPIINAGDFYPGCYARAQVFARAWESLGKQGVQLILDHVQKTKDGPSFSGKKSASEVFAPITGGKAKTESMDDEDDSF